jgi:hypothetical protein
VDLVRNDRVFPLLKLSHKRHKKHKEDLKPEFSDFFVLFVPFVAKLLVDGICHFDSDGFCLFASKFG